MCWLPCVPDTHWRGANMFSRCAACSRRCGAVVQVVRHGRGERERRGGDRALPPQQGERIQRVQHHCAQHCLQHHAFPRRLSRPPLDSHVRHGRRQRLAPACVELAEHRLLPAERLLQSRLRLEARARRVVGRHASHVDARFAQEAAEQLRGLRRALAVLQVPDMPSRRRRRTASPWGWR